MWAGPVLGGIIAFAIVVGCLFRGLYLLNSINNRLDSIAPHKDKVQDAYDKYLEEREKQL